MFRVRKGFPMSRTACSLLAMMTASIAAGPVVAADWDEMPAWGGDLRGSHWVEPKDWTQAGDPSDSLGFEFGTRYWYSMGGQSATVAGDDFTSDDTSHILEGHLRIEDARTRTYAKGLAGYGVAIRGQYDAGGTAGETLDGRIGYAGADIGYMAFGSDRGNEGVGPLLGYLYWNDSPRTRREAFTTSSSVTSWSSSTGEWSLGFDSQDDNMDIHALRLGVQTKASLGEMIDVTAELAAVPYAHVSGVKGGYSATPGATGFPVCNTTPPGACPTYTFQSSPTSFSGWGYGGMGEVMVGFHPTENLSFRLGGRAWYLQGTYDATFSTLHVKPPQLQPPVEIEGSDPVAFEDPVYGPPSTTSEDYVLTANPFSVFRYGLLAELTYRF
jgi:hypothetical protein